MKDRSRLNPPLEVGDEIILLTSIEDQVPAGTKGVVTKVSPFTLGPEGTINYNVEWENGSSLAMLSDVDSWTLSSLMKIKENINEQDHPANQISNILENFKFSLLRKFLGKLRDSGIVNMFGASPYLYMGRDKIESIHKYDSVVENKEEEFEEMLDLAEAAKNEMIRGTVEILEKTGKNWDVDDVNKKIGKNAQEVLRAYMATYMI